MAIEMNSQKSLLTKFAIFLFCCSLCIRTTSAHRLLDRKLADSNSESSEEYIKGGHLRQHPWERHRFRHRHGRIYQNDLDFVNVPAGNGESENPGGNVPTYTLSHSPTTLHMPRLKAKLADHEPSHPWHTHEPHRRHRFHHRRWHAGLFRQGNNDFSGEDMQVGLVNGAESCGHAASSGNNYNGEREWDSIESLEATRGRQNEEKTTQKTTTSTTTTISPITHEIITSTEKTTTIIPKMLYETTTAAISSDAAHTTTIEPAENIYAIDIRSGF